MTELLTVEQLENMAPGQFATGTGIYPELFRGPIRWVAVRGGHPDWALYYHHDYMSEEYVKSYGDKAFTESVIRELVPCTDEVWARYRR